jgi:hypothetical protein
VTEVAGAARRSVEQQARRLARVEVDPAGAAARAGELGTGLDGVYGEAAGATSRHGERTRATLGAAAAASSDALHGTASQVGQHLDQGAARHAGSAGEVADQVAAASGRVTDLLSTSGSAAVERATSNVRGGADAAVSSLSQAGGLAADHLSGLATEASGRVTQGVEDAHGRVTEGQARFDAAYSQRQEGASATQRLEVQRSVWSWLKGQWDDFLKLVTDPAFLVGLGVTLVLLPFLGAGAIVVGGAVGGMVAGIRRNQAEGRPWYAWKNVVLGGLEGAVVGLIFAGATAALVYFNVGLLAGALIMGLLSAGIGIVTNLIHGQPWDRGLLANFFLAAIFHLIGGAIKGMRGGRATPIERPGTYGTVDPSFKPGNFEFTDTVDTRGAADVSVTTKVEQAGTGKTGEAQRVYFRADRRLVYDHVDLSQIPAAERWVRPAPDAEPIRLESYVTMRQMRLMETELNDPQTFAGPRVVVLRNVVNLDTVFQLARAGRPGTPERAAALRTCKSVSYAERPIRARGERITSVSESGGREQSAGGCGDPAKMAAYGFKPDDPVQVGFQITIEVEPVPEAERVAPPADRPPPAIPVPAGGPPDRDADD